MYVGNLLECVQENLDEGEVNPQTHTEAQYRAPYFSYTGICTFVMMEV